MPSLGGLLKKRRTKDSQTLTKELQQSGSFVSLQTSPNGRSPPPIKHPHYTHSPILVLYALYCSAILSLFFLLLGFSSLSSPILPANPPLLFVSVLRANRQQTHPCSPLQVTSPPIPPPLVTTSSHRRMAPVSRILSIPPNQTAPHRMPSRSNKNNTIITANSLSPTRNRTSVPDVRIAPPRTNTL